MWHVFGNSAKRFTQGEMHITSPISEKTWSPALNDVINNYSPRWRWSVVDIYRVAKRRAKYLPLFIDAEVKNCFCRYHTSWINCGPKSKFIFWKYTAKISIKACPNSAKRSFIVKCSVSPSCRQIKLLQAIVKLLRWYFLNGWVKFLLLLKPSWKTSDVSLFSLWF